VKRKDRFSGSPGTKTDERNHWGDSQRSSSGWGRVRAKATASRLDIIFGSTVETAQWEGAIQSAEESYHIGVGGNAREKDGKRGWRSRVEESGQNIKTKENWL